MDDDLASLFFDDDEPDAQAKAKALSAALRRQRDVGTLGMLTGDKVLSPLGKTMYGDAGQREGLLADAGKTRLGKSLAKMKAAADSKKSSSDAAEGLRKELFGNPVTKAAQEVATAFEKMQRAAATPSAAGDLSLIFSYMKMLDPTSSVKEGEFANAQNATGVPGQVLNMYNRALSGQRLAPEQRQDFMGQAGGLYESQMGRYRQLADQYGGLAERSGVSRGDVVLDLGFQQPGQKRAAPAAAAPGGRTEVKDRSGKVLGYINADGTEELVP